MKIRWMKIHLKSSILHLQSLENVTIWNLDEVIFEVLTKDLEEKVEPKTKMKGRTRKFYTFV